MPKEERVYERRGGQGWMNWNSLTERQIEAIGLHMEGVQHRIENEIYPAVSLKNRDGSWIVNAIVETAVKRLARDVRSIDAEAWKRYEQSYLDNRTGSNTHKLYISEAMTGDIEVIAEYLQKADIIDVMHGKKVNSKMIYAIALSHTFEQIG